MGPRDRSANKVAPKRQVVINQRNGLPIPGDGGLEGSCGSSSGSEAAFLQAKAAKNQVHYVSSDGSLFTITTNQNHLKKNGAISLSQHVADASSGSPNSSSTANLEPPAATQRQQQHRRLQNQVHRQLQRIYGSGERQMSANQAHLMEDRQQYLFKQRKQHAQQVNSDQRGPLPSQVRQSTSSSFADHQSAQFTPSHLKNPSSMMMSNNQQQQDQIYDSLSSNSVSKHLSDVYYIQDNQRPPPIGAIPEECGEAEEDDLLIPETGAVAKRAAIDRKHQLEDLHYATATAAALLSATANAAAAFAATEKQFNLPNKHHRTQQNIINSIYSDAYQEVRKQRCHNDHEAKARYQQQNLRRNMPIYSDALEQSQFLEPSDRQMHLEPPAPPSAIYSPMTRGNLAQSQIYSLLPAHYQHYQQPSNFNRPTPPQPPVRRMMNPSLDFQRQQQRQRMMQQRAQLQQVGPAPHATVANTAPQVPALAIVHHGKSAAIKANLIGRMLVNNILAAQRAASGGNEAQYMAVNGLPVGRGRLPNKMLDSQNLSHNMIGPDKLYRTTAPVFSVTSGMAPSDASGHSNVPLVIDRGLRSLTFMERVCRIDLTLFWWSLLIVSFLFIGAIVTISRYIF